MSDRIERDHERGVPERGSTRGARREKTADDFLPDALERTLGMEGVRRRRTRPAAAPRPGGRS